MVEHQSAQMATVQKIKNEIRCRASQIDLLTGMIRENPCSLPSSIFVYGLPGTGKSLVISSLLKHRNIIACYSNCIEFYSQKLIYENILNNLTNTLPRSENGYKPFSACDNFAEFIYLLRKIIEPEKRYALVFENAERLRDCGANVFPTLCRLQEFCGSLNICVIFLSRLSVEKYRDTLGFLEPLEFYFPQYTKDELIQILISLQPLSDLSIDGYKNYINLLFSVFSVATQNLPELLYLSNLNLSSYMEPIMKWQVKENDLSVLWRNIEPKLKNALSTVYLREVSSDQFQKMQIMIDCGSKEKRTALGIPKMELPFYSKFLMIAAYLASYNPASSDRRFFTKNHGRKRKTQAIIKAKQRSCSQLVGPKPFKLDRLLAIFYAIIEDKVSPTCHLFSQIGTLVSLRLLSAIGCGDALASPKYKSNVSLDFIRSIARTVDFDIIQYLYDYS